MAARLYCPLPLQTGAELNLPAQAARHVQVLRLQPGDAVELFHGGLLFDNEVTANLSSDASELPAYATGWFEAVITRMGRSDVAVRVGDWHAPRIPSQPAVHIACGVPANERMDWLVEKAAELGAGSIQPLLTRRSVLRLSGERALKRVAHWQAIAVSACEQWAAPPCLGCAPCCRWMLSCSSNKTQTAHLARHTSQPQRVGYCPCRPMHSLCGRRCKPCRPCSRSGCCLAPKVGWMQQKKPWRCSRAGRRYRWVRAPCAPKLRP